MHIHIQLRYTVDMGYSLIVVETIRHPSLYRCLVAIDECLVLS